MQVKKQNFAGYPREVAVCLVPTTLSPSKSGNYHDFFEYHFFAFFQDGIYLICCFFFFKFHNQRLPYIPFFSLKLMRWRTGSWVSQRQRLGCLCTRWTFGHVLLPSLFPANWQLNAEAGSDSGLGSLTRLSVTVCFSIRGNTVPTFYSSFFFFSMLAMVRPQCLDPLICSSCQTVMF